jgi:hypothetical protein
MEVHLDQKEIEFIQSLGMEKTKEAAYHFVRTKLVKDDAIPDEGHPVFKAMNAIGADNRENVERNFSIPKDRELAEPQVDMLVENIMGWIRGEVQSSGKVQAKIAEF